MPQIIPIKELKNTSEISEMCHKSDEPIYITKNGYGDMVIMSMENYEKTIKMLNIYKELELSEQQICWMRLIAYMTGWKIIHIS